MHFSGLSSATSSSAGQESTKENFTPRSGENTLNFQYTEKIDREEFLEKLRQKDKKYFIRLLMAELKHTPFSEEQKQEKITLLVESYFSESDYLRKAEAFLDMQSQKMMPAPAFYYLAATDTPPDQIARQVISVAAAGYSSPRKKMARLIELTALGQQEDSHLPEQAAVLLVLGNTLRDQLTLDETTTHTPPHPKEFIGEQVEAAHLDLPSQVSAPDQTVRKPSKTSKKPERKIQTEVHPRQEDAPGQSDWRNSVAKRGSGQSPARSALRSKTKARTPIKKVLKHGLWIGAGVSLPFWLQSLLG